MLTRERFSKDSFYDLGDGLAAGTYAYGMDHSKPFALDPRHVDSNITFVYPKATYEVADVPYGLTYVSFSPSFSKPNYEFVITYCSSYSVFCSINMLLYLGLARVPAPALNPSNDTYPTTLMLLPNRVLYQVPPIFGRFTPQTTPPTTLSAPAKKSAVPHTNPPTSSGSPQLCTRRRHQPALSATCYRASNASERNQDKKSCSRVAT